MLTPFIVLACVSVTTYIVASMIIVGELQKRKIPINWFFLKALIPKYAHQYRKITLQERGKVSSLYYVWLISINITLLSGILIVIMKIGAPHGN